MFRSLLIANRGEIALRVIQSAQQMGIRTVALFSDPDRDAPHVHAADEAHALPGASAAETYLRADRILEIAAAAQVEAIHPGYGFLSENANFAEACGRAGITFVGPAPAAMRALGDKLAAKELLQRAGVPVVPGWNAPADAAPEEFRPHAQRIGYPVLIKAAAGGGGKGMRLAQDEYELVAAVETAAREARAAFGDARVFIEKYIARPRHVEFQIFGDRHGHVAHLNERECSIQRRYQKLIEETPSTALTPELRAAMGQAAVRAAQAVQYFNAGTVEFLLDASGKFYFLEVNARLQVEHPITELTARLDLVRAQLRVAAGEPLPFPVEGVAPVGHAIECRICAEDPARNFMPATGRLVVFRPPVGPNIRVDTGVVEGSEVSVHYDSMLAKLIVWGRDRAEAIDRARWALRRFVILGVAHNIEFLDHVLAHPEFVGGRLHTHFLLDNPITLEPATDLSPEAVYVAAWAQRHAGSARSAASAAATAARPPSPWDGGGWRQLD